MFQCKTKFLKKNKKDQDFRDNYLCPFWQQLVLLHIFHLKLLHEEDVVTGITISYHHPALCVQGAWVGGGWQKGWR